MPMRGSRFLWSDEEIEVLRERYPVDGAAALAEVFDLPVSRIYRAAARYGANSKLKVVVGSRFDAFLKKKVKAGWLDAEIAAKWSEDHPTKSIGRRHVCTRRRQLKLPSNAHNQRHRDQVAARTREQLRRKGLKSLAEERVHAYRRFARERGWPETLRPREVQILDFLYEQGPHTRRQIAEAIGMQTERNQRSWLSCKYGRGSYLANLMHAGLVVRLPNRINEGRGRGKGVYLYAVNIHVRRGVSHDPSEKQLADTL